MPDSPKSKLRRFTFDGLANADLQVDAVYEGGAAGTSGDDPIARLLSVGNMGGFRSRGPRSRPTVVVLTSSGHNNDWPDFLDPETGIFTYFGDNRTPGHAITETKQGGNRILEATFQRLHADPSERSEISPFFIFESTGNKRDNRFLGLAVPGAEELEPTEDLVALWRTRDGRRFQNYRARFSILDVPIVPRAWIEQIVDGDPLGDACPEPFSRWVLTGEYATLRAPRTTVHRSREEQLPSDLSILDEIHQRFIDDWHGFEACAAEVWRMMHGPAVRNIEMTRPTADGGRDAIGHVAIGPGSDPVLLDFCLEAKCYAPGRTSVGVKDVARLISRLRHRQFGVLVTTSYVAKQAYEEVRNDAHPVVIVCGLDIVETLRIHGYSTVEQVRTWLQRDFRQTIS